MHAYPQIQQKMRTLYAREYSYIHIGYSAELCIQGDLVRGCLALGARTGG